MIPALVHGRARLESRPSKSLELAIALNGIVRAVTRSDASRDGEFFALIPESALVAGANRLEVFVIEEGATGPRLGLVSSSAAHAYTLEEESIRGADGRRIRLARDPGRGSARLEWQAASRVLTGSTDRPGRSRILVFHEGDLIYAGETDPSFSLVLPGDVSDQIRVFVLSDAGAVEIEVAVGP